LGFIPPRAFPKILDGSALDEIKSWLGQMRGAQNSFCA
jgi:hypothetical protein